MSKSSQLGKSAAKGGKGSDQMGAGGTTTPPNIDEKTDGPKDLGSTQPPKQDAPPAAPPQQQDAPPAAPPKQDAPPAAPPKQDAPAQGDPVTTLQTRGETSHTAQETVRQLGAMGVDPKPLFQAALDAGGQAGQVLSAVQSTAASINNWTGNRTLGGQDAEDAQAFLDQAVANPKTGKKDPVVRARKAEIKQRFGQE